MSELFGSVRLLTKGVIKHEKARKDQPIIKQDFKEGLETEDYEKVLLGVKGLGVKSVKKIIAKYPSKDSLKKAFFEGVVVHNKEEINEAIRELMF